MQDDNRGSPIRTGHVRTCLDADFKEHRGSPIQTGHVRTYLDVDFKEQLVLTSRTESPMDSLILIVSLGESWQRVLSISLLTHGVIPQS